MWREVGETPASMMVRLCDLCCCRLRCVAVFCCSVPRRLLQPYLLEEGHCHSSPPEGRNLLLQPCEPPSLSPSLSYIISEQFSKERYFCFEDIFLLEVFLLSHTHTTHTHTHTHTQQVDHWYPELIDIEEEAKQVHKTRQTGNSGYCCLVCDLYPRQP